MFSLPIVQDILNNSRQTIPKSKATLTYIHRKNVGEATGQITTLQFYPLLGKTEHFIATFQIV